jgi:predicted secreted Zn-dependent protease
MERARIGSMAGLVLVILVNIPGCGAATAAASPGSSSSLGPPPSPGRSSSLGSIPPGMTVDVKKDYYDVYGSTVGEIRASLKRAGPRVGDSIWHGKADWRVNWRTRYAQGPSRCRVTEASVDFSVIITLPRWSPHPNTDYALIAQWNTYLRALELHENGHRDIGASAAREILSTLRSMSSPRCDDMNDQATEAARRITDRHKELNQDYDRDTRHGRTQGATWPPPR